MSSPSRDQPPGTVVVQALAEEGRDFASVRSRKQSLLAQLQSDSADDGCSPEELLAQWPVDPETDRDAASLIFQDFCRRRQQDPSRVSIEDVQSRFPAHKESLASLVRHDALLRSFSGSEVSAPRLCLPEVGDRLFGFRLIFELGRGAFARVFLATQDDLASRPVVLKVSNLEGSEPQTLALLQHTHIVPIHSVHEDKRAGLRAVCMPYFGGASLSDVLKELWVGLAPVHSGAQLVGALKAVQAPDPAASSARTETPCREAKVLKLLESLAYPQAAAWIVARLAEGLQHSHNRGVLHRDVKPSNVLLGTDGQPMLLDFNLAQVTRGDRAKIVLGGTISYMAPEHLRSIASRDPADARHVDHRADLYSLGMVLHEMLVGRSPFAESASYTPLPLLVEAMAVERGRAAPSLRASLPDAPWDLESILRKCLAPQPADRYQQAEHLAEDLQRFLDDRPLRYAPQLSLFDRARKWRRRHPRLFSAGGVGVAAAFLVCTLGTALVGSQQLLATTKTQLGQTQEDLERANAQERKRAFRATAIRALCQVNTTTDGRDQLRAGRTSCEEALNVYQVLERDDWQRLAAHLDEAERQRLADDVRELLLLLAWAHAELSPTDSDALKKALVLLDRCEAVSGPTLRALWEDRALYLERLGEKDRAAAARARAAELRPASARDHYLLATSLARHGRYADAVRELNAALRLNPDHYWSLVQRGICRREQGELLLAAADFSRCAGLEPSIAWGHYNLGYILEHSGRREEAVACYTEALRCDEGFALAYLNRGLASVELGRFTAGLDDLDRAAAAGRDDASLHLGRGQALEGLSRPEPADQAYAQALVRIASLPKAKRVVLWLNFGFAAYRRRPDDADRAFTQVLRLQAHQPQALYGRAMILTERGKEAEAIPCFDEALTWHPGFADARRSRAVLLARQGKLRQAQDDVERCLQHDPRSGITLYAAACVLALAAEHSNGEDRRRLEDQALARLADALRQGYGKTGAANDPDLRPVRHRQEFQKLVCPDEAN